MRACVPVYLCCCGACVSCSHETHNGVGILDHSQVETDYVLLKDLREKKRDLVAALQVVLFCLLAVII